MEGKKFQKYTKLYKSVQNYTFGQKMSFWVANSHLFKPFLTLLDLGGHYGHKMCVFPQEYELFPY